MIKQLAEKIKQAPSVLLTTHRQCDGDGLGSELAMYHALKKTGKKVRILNVDGTPKKYQFLQPDQYIQFYEGTFDPLEEMGLAMVFDTNDRRLIQPLYQELETHCKEIIFVDHHPVLKEGPAPTQESLIEIRAASTGELTFDIIQALDIPLDQKIAQALYASIVFDTQLFRYVRNSPRSHEVAIELMKQDISPSDIHRHLFGNFTPAKLKFMAQALTNLEFFQEERLAFIHIKTSELKSMGLQINDSFDLIDMVMNIENLEVAALLREDAQNVFKLSLRSKGLVPVLSVAESFGGGGHLHAAGALIKGDFHGLKPQLLKALGLALN